MSQILTSSTMLHPLLLWQVSFVFSSQPRVNETFVTIPRQAGTHRCSKTLPTSTIRCYFTCAAPVDEIRSLQLPPDQLRGSPLVRPSDVFGVLPGVRCFMIGWVMFGQLMLVGCMHAVSGWDYSLANLGVASTKIRKGYCHSASGPPDA